MVKAHRQFLLLAVAGLSFVGMTVAATSVEVPDGLKDSRARFDKANTAAKAQYAKTSKVAIDAHLVDCRLALKKAMAKGDLEASTKINEYIKALTGPTTMPASTQPGVDASTQPAYEPPDYLTVSEWRLAKLSPRLAEVGYASYTVIPRGTPDVSGDLKGPDNKSKIDWIFAHAPSKLIFDIPEGVTRFTATARCLHVNHKNHVGVRVSAGAQQLFEKNGFSTLPGSAVKIDVPLPPGAKQLILEGYYTGDYHAEGHVFWEEAEFKAK